MESQEKKEGLALLSDETLAAIVDAGLRDGDMTVEARIAFSELSKRDD